MKEFEDLHLAYLRLTKLNLLIEARVFYEAQVLFQTGSALKFQDNSLSYYGLLIKACQFKQSESFCAIISVISLKITPDEEPDASQVIT